MLSQCVSSPLDMAFRPVPLHTHVTASSPPAPAHKFLGGRRLLSSAGGGNCVHVARIQGLRPLPPRVVSSLQDRRNRRPIALQSLKRGEGPPPATPVRGSPSRLPVLAHGSRGEGSHGSREGRVERDVLGGEGSDTWQSRGQGASQGLGLKLLLGFLVVGAALVLSMPMRAAAQSRKEGGTATAPAASTSVAGSAASRALLQSVGAPGDAMKGSAGEDAAPTGGDAEKSVLATQMLEGYLTQHPDDVDALKMLLRVRMKGADFQGGLSTLDQLIRIQPNEREWRFLRAQVLEFSGDLAGARNAFQAILDQEPFSARALQGLASIMRQSGEDSLVLGMVEDAIEKASEEEKGSDVTNLKLLLGQLHAMQGNINEAISQYDEVLKDHPRDFRPYLCKGLVLSLAGEGEKADKLFKEFRERCPKAYAPYLDNVIVRSSVEARRLQMEEKAVQTQGTQERPARQMKQPKSAET